MSAFKLQAKGGGVEAAKTEKHQDHTVLHPPQTLKNKAYLAMRTGDPTPDDVIKEGETSLEEVAVNFQNWMLSETKKLADAREKFRESGADKEISDALFQAAHTVRGNAGVFGFPLAGRVADSLAKLIDRCPPDRLPAQLVDQHVDAVRAMVREDARGVGHPRARELALALIDVTAEYLNVVAPETA
jgi:chemotaxis protein histidine kinase CheA